MQLPNVGENWIFLTLPFDGTPDVNPNQKVHHGVAVQMIEDKNDEATTGCHVKSF